MTRFFAQFTLLMFIVGCAAGQSGTTAAKDPQTDQIRTAARTKLDSQLRGALERGGLAQIAGPQRRTSAVDIDRDGKVLVDIEGVVTPELMTAISDLNGVVVTRFPAYQSVRARLPLSKLQTLAERSDVKFVRAAEQAITNPTPPEAR